MTTFDGRRIMGHDLFEKLARRLLVDGALKTKHAPGPRHLHGSASVIPLVLLLMGNDPPHSTQPPHPAMLGMQPEAWLPAPSGAALRAKAPPFGYLAPLDSSHTHTRTTVRGGKASAASFASSPPGLKASVAAGSFLTWLRRPTLSRAPSFPKCR